MLISRVTDVWTPHVRFDLDQPLLTADITVTSC